MDAPDVRPGTPQSGGSTDLLIGQKLALAGASLALGVCSFISLLGMEKAILAIVFGLLALRKSPVLMPIRRGFAKFGVVLGVCQIVVVLTLLVLFWDHVWRFFEFLERFQAEM